MMDAKKQTKELTSRFFEKGPQILKELRTKLQTQSMTELPSGTTHSQSAPSSTKTSSFSFLQGFFFFKKEKKKRKKVGMQIV